MIENRTFGSRIKDERKRLRISQGELAERLGVSRSSIAFYETERTVPDVDFLVQADAIGMDTSYLVFGRRGTEQAGRLLDWDLLASILQGIREFCAEAGLTVSPEKEIAIAKLLYGQFARASAVDAELLKQVLKLAA